MSHHPRDKVFVTAALRGDPAIIVKRLAEMRAHIIIHQPVARPRIKTNNIKANNIRQSARI